MCSLGRNPGRPEPGAGNEVNVAGVDPGAGGRIIGDTKARVTTRNAAGVQLAAIPAGRPRPFGPEYGAVTRPPATLRRADGRGNARAREEPPPRDMKTSPLPTR